MRLLPKRNETQTPCQTVNQTSHLSSSLSTKGHSVKRLSLLMYTALIFSVACTPPCRFNEEANCEEGGEMMGGEVNIEGEIIGEGSGSSNGGSGNNNGGSGNNNGGSGVGLDIDIVPGDHLAPKEIDLLVMAPFDQSLIGEYYGDIIEATLAQLARYEITVAHAAIAPMYRRLNNDTPILYGTPDAEAEFTNYSEAFAYFSSEEGLLPLDNQVEHDGQNLLQLGARLGTAGVYHPQTGSEGSQYLFRAPKDGMLVVWINPFERRCNLDDCEGIEGSLADQLLATNDENQATWLSLGGRGRLDIDQIVHAFVGTEETGDFAAFEDRCKNRVGLPSRILDHIEPSSIDLYKQLNLRLSGAGLASYRVDFCAAVSDEGFDALEAVALKVRQRVQ